MKDDLIKFKEDIVKQVQDIVSVQSNKNDQAWSQINSDMDKRLNVTLPKILNDSMSTNRREQIAALAMQGILSNDNYQAPRRERLDGMAKDAVLAADALLKALST
tara:strand:+ start:449 stop:763 length:315 start_codon:yes stop_codon:yes gene_type:complete